MKQILTITVFCLTLSNLIADERPIERYPDLSTIISGDCARAEDSMFALENGTECKISVRVHMYLRPGLNLIRLAKQKKLHPITFWLEERIEDGTGSWRKITNTRQYRYNDVPQEVPFTVTHTGIFRAVVDYKGQYSFSDLEGSQYKVSVK